MTKENQIKKCKFQHQGEPYNSVYIVQYIDNKEASEDCSMRFGSRKEAKKYLENCEYKQ